MDPDRGSMNEALRPNALESQRGERTGPGARPLPAPPRPSTTTVSASSSTGESEETTERGPAPAESPTRTRTLAIIDRLHHGIHAVLNSHWRVRGLDLRYARTVRHYLRHALQEHIEHSELPASGTSDFDALQRYRVACRQLLPSDRDLIVGRLELGYSYEQLATATDRSSAQAARAAVRQALARLAERMGVLKDASASALAAAVLDGETIDWARARQRAVEATSPFLADLEVIDRTAKASRSSRIAPELSAPDESLSRPVFRTLLVALAAGHITAGVVGYAMGVSAPSPTAAPLAIATVLVFAGASGWLGVGARDDPRASSLAIFYLLIAAAFARRFLPPAEAGVLSAVLKASPDAFLPFFLWQFVGQFPRTVRFGPSDWFCRLASSVSLVAGFVLFSVTVVLAVHSVAWLRVAARSHPGGLYWGINFGLAALALPVAWWRSRSAPSEERRRLEVFTAGLLVGTAPMVADVILEVIFPSFARAMAGNHDVRAQTFQLLLLSTPFITAYSVVVDRVLDVHVVAGRALKVVFARATVTLIAGLPFVALAFLAYARRDLSLAQLLSSRTGLAIAMLAVVGLVMWAASRRVLGAVDRRLFGPAADVARDVPELAAAIRNATSENDLALLLETRLASLFDATHATMLMTDLSGEWYGPVRSEGPPLSVRSALGAIVATDARALPVGAREMRSCFRFLPPREQNWVCTSNAALLVPLVASHDARVGLIATGPKTNGRPYGREDILFLTTIAPAIALALEMRRAQEHNDAEPAAECLRCGRVAATGGICTCGSSRRTATLPAVLAGKFRVESRVGAGGMGVVYRARDVGLDRVVALKTLPRLSPRAGERLHREAQMMAAVVHPNLATIYSLERWRNTPILVVEFLDGGSLSTRLPAPQPIDEIVQLGIQLASALQHLHQRRVLHGDVKPSNIAFSGTGVPKLLDFGLARFLSDVQYVEASVEPGATQSMVLAGAVIAGTPLYLSPEAVRGSEGHDDFDLWALGMVVYEAIAGRHPFASVTIGEVLDKVRAAAIPDVRQFRPDCPAAIAAALGIMLSRSRSDRPRTAADVLGMLERCAQVGGGRSTILNKREATHVTSQET